MKGDHSVYHEDEKVFIANTQLENAVKIRCADEGRYPRDIFDEEASK